MARFDVVSVFKGRLHHVLLVASVLAVLAGCQVVDQRTQKELEVSYGPNAPRLEATFAAQAITPGDEWKIWLKGSDPDGDIQYIQVWLEFPSRASTPVRLEVDPDQARHLSGYLILNTLEFGGDIQDLVSGWLRLRVVLEDRAEHQSEAAEFSLQFSFGAQASQPPPGVFQDHFLGKIPVEFAPVEPAEPGFRMRP
jgi:hypothetical protein